MEVRAVKLVLIADEATEVITLAAEGKVARLLRNALMGGEWPVRPKSVPGQLAGNPHWWRRGDSTFRSFRCGLDYAFIRCAQMSAWMRSVLSG
jgi:hypothetical protein